MAFEIKLQQKLSQTLVMTPQLQQAIRLLQLGRLEYQEAIEQELLENPFLEEAQSLAANESFQQRLENQNSDTSDTRETIQLENALPAEPEQFGDLFGKKGSRDFGDERRPVENIAGKSDGLTDHLLFQLRALELGNTELRIALEIIGNLDLNGYLSCSTEELAAILTIDVEDMNDVLEIVQTLDPTGIAARDLRECLLIQLSHMGQQGSLAWRIVDKHLSDLEHRRYDSLAKSLGVPLDSVRNAVEMIQKLEPRPGRPFAEEQPIYITPDVYVRKVGSEYIVTLNENDLPRLRLSREYEALLKSSDGQQKEYLQERLRAASWLIRSIHQRQQTILKVTESIMRFQRDFLEHGVAAMRPLVLREIADNIEMHESTVSRVTTNKYVHTPHGVFELKYFFSSGIKSSGGGEVSSESVKERIRALVSKEDRNNPLSDQTLVGILKSEGIDIARRTVAKYREMLGILSSARRKSAF